MASETQTENLGRIADAVTNLERARRKLAAIRRATQDEMVRNAINDIEFEVIDAVNEIEAGLAGLW